MIFNQGTETCQTVSRTKQRERWHCKDQKFCEDKWHVTFTCSSQTLRRTVQHLVAKRVRSCPEERHRVCDSVTNAGRESWKQLRQTMKGEDILGQECSEEASTRDCCRRRRSTSGCSANGEDGRRSSEQHLSRSSTVTHGSKKRRQYTAQDRTGVQFSVSGGRYS